MVSQKLISINISILSLTYLDLVKVFTHFIHSGPGGVCWGRTNNFGNAQTIRKCSFFQFSTVQEGCRPLCGRKEELLAPTGPVAFGSRFYTFVTLCPIPARGAGDDIFTGLTTGLLVSGPGCQIFKMPGKGRNRGTNDRAGCEIFKMPRREPRVKI